MILIVAVALGYVLGQIVFEAVGVLIDRAGRSVGKAFNHMLERKIAQRQKGIRVDT
jgi:hypothetical protein